MAKAALEARDMNMARPPWQEWLGWSSMKRRCSGRKEPLFEVGQMLGYHENLIRCPAAQHAWRRCFEAAVGQILNEPCPNVQTPNTPCNE